MLWWVVQNTVLTGLLALGVALVCWLARPRPALRHALWLIVLGKLITPPCVYWPWSIPAPQWLVASAVIAEPAADGAAPPRILMLMPVPRAVEQPQTATVVEAPFVGRDLEEVARLPEADVSAAGAPVQVVRWWNEAWIGLALLAAWATGATLLVGMQIAAAVRFRRGWGHGAARP